MDISGYIHQQLIFTTGYIIIINEALVLIIDQILIQMFVIRALLINIILIDFQEGVFSC